MNGKNKRTDKAVLIKPKLQGSIYVLRFRPIRLNDNDHIIVVIIKNDMPNLI